MNPAQLLAHFDRVSEAPDAITRLRRFILDLAVRGKLVDQDPGDEPASELLKRIRAQKARLVKEGKIRKQEPTPPVGIEAQPFELPTNWEWEHFGAVADFSAGRTPSRHDFSYWNTGDYPWISIADMKDGKVLISTKETVSEKAKNQIFRSEPLPVGTLIMSFKLTIGKIARLGVPAFHNEAIISIRPHLPDMDAYLFKVLPRFSQQGDTKDAIKGATLNRDSITNILIPLPPLAEQHRIVAKVDELMALCNRLDAAQAERECRRDRLAAASLHRLNNGADAECFREYISFYLTYLPRLTTRPEHIKQLRQTILNLAVRGRLVPQDPNDESASELLKRIQAVKVRLVKEGKISRDRPLPLIAEEDNLKQLPNGWEWVRMQDAFDVRDGTHDTPKYIEHDGVPLITSRNFVDGRISFEDAKLISWDDHNSIKKRSGVDQGDILYSMIGGNIGNQVMVETDREFSIKNVAMFKYYSKSDTPPAYLDLFLKTVTIGLQSQAAGGAQPFVSLKQLRSIPFPMPPLPEQRRIVAKVNELMELCDRLEAQLTTTAFTRHQLLEATIHQTISRQVELQQGAR